MIAINDVPLPSPHNLSVQVSMKAGVSQYNALGQLVQDGMQEKRRVEITWVRLPSSALSALASLVEGTDFFTLSYPDPFAGKRTMQGRYTEKYARVWKYQADEAAWADVKLVVEEQ